MIENKIGKIENIIDKDTVGYLLTKFDALPKKDNGLRINADTLVDQDFNKKFNEKITEILMPHFKGHVNHATIYSDYHPGGIHSDGWVDKPEQNKLAYTFLIPLQSEYEKNATIVFEETSEEAVTYNQATGLGQKGVASYQQTALPDADHFIDADTQNKWFPHLNEEKLPFRIAEVLTWEVGTALYWPRINLHASAWFPTDSNRKAIVILTNE